MASPEKPLASAAERPTRSRQKRPGVKCVAKYFMNLRDGTEELLDPEGIEYASMDALRKAVLVTVRDLMCGDMVAGVLDFRFRIDAEDADV